MKQNNNSSFCFALVVLVRSQRRRCALVGNDHVSDNTVLPWAVREVQIDVIKTFGFLVAIERVKIARVLILSVRRVLTLNHHHHYESSFLAGLDCRTVFRRVLSRLALHHIIRFILLDHRISVRHGRKIVVESLSELIIGIPCSHLIEIEVSKRAIESNDIVVLWQRVLVISTCSTLLTVSKQLNDTNAVIRSNSRRFNNNVHACRLICRDRHISCVHSRLFAITCKHHLLSSDIEAYETVAKRIYKTRFRVCHIRRLDSE